MAIERFLISACGRSGVIIAIRQICRLTPLDIHFILLLLLFFIIIITIIIIIIIIIINQLHKVEYK